MSEKIDIIIDSSTDVEAGNQIVSASSDNNVDVEILEPDYDITINKKEYIITGDNLYIPKSYEESPQWLKDIIGTITDFTLNQKLTEIGALSSTLTGLIEELQVAKNTYTNSIISSAEIDERINARIETLNSSIAESDATIVDLISTKATPTEASSLALNVLTSSINDGAIKSLVSNLQNTISNATSTMSNNIDILHSEMTGNFEADANAIHSLNTYVGVDSLGEPDGTGALADIVILQKQNDGVIETVTGTYDVMINPQDPNLAELVISAEPYASWKALDVAGIDTRLSHIGDVYIKYSVTSNGARQYIGSYKFIRTIVDYSDAHKSTDADGFTWALIIDQASQDAYTQALNAYDLADNKRRVFTTTPVAPYDIGDLWTREVNGSSQIWKCSVERAQIGYYNQSDWSVASTDDTATVELQTGLSNGTTTIKLTNAYVGTVTFTTYIASEIDGKVGVYSGETAPIAGQPNGVAVNDIYLWFTTASKVLASGATQVYDITRTYKYSGSVWAEITTDSNITALADLADGKRTVFSGNTVPTGAVARDVWIPSANNGTYLQGEIYQYNGTSWIIATKYSADIEAVRSNLQSQVDGKVETYYSATVPTGMTAVNNGDYWYCMADVSTYKKGKIYKYVHATTSWIETADVSRYAFDTADGKASIFSSISVPTTGYKVNDMLIVVGSFTNGTTTFSDGVVLSSTTTRTSGFTHSDWIKKINDTEDLDAFVETMEGVVTSLQNQIDGKIESWYTASTNDPKTAWTDAAIRSMHSGDMWYQTDTKISYYYDSITNSWRLIDDAKAIKALANAATAQATADGKISSYYMATLSSAQNMSTAWTALEKTNNVGDLVVIYNDATLDNNGTWRWNGTSWETTRDKKLVSLASDVTTLSTNLQNGTGTWATGDSNVTNSLTTTINNKVATVESKWAYNSVVGINGVYKKSGFGLTTNYTSGSGTEIDPYVSEFWIDASRMKFTNSAMTGSKAPFTIDASGATPEITFNGKVSFNNVTGYTAPDISGDINANNDVFAQKLGYANYQAMVTAASSGQTIINGGYVNTLLVQANSINAGMINTTGLIAENISANTIVGKTLMGTNITGASITGSVIKASYLDLDGQLEVLTNYHISTVMYNSNPALYTDSVYLSSSNEYRIPSMSIIHEETVETSIQSAGQVFNSKIRSYNCGNAGHNIKCVKSNPPVTINSNQFLTFGISIYNGRADWSYEDFEFNILSNKKSSRLDIYICGIFVVGLYVKADYASTSEGFSTVNFHLYNNNGQQVTSGTTYYSNGISFVVYFDVAANAEVRCVLNTQNPTISFTDDNQSLFKIVNSGGNDIEGVGLWNNVHAYTYSTISFNSANFTINNMI